MVRRSVVNACMGIGFLSGIFGCGTPDSVKVLSAAQVKNTEAYCADLDRTTSALKVHFERYQGEMFEEIDKDGASSKADAEKAARARSQTEKWDAARTAAEVATEFSRIDAKLNEQKAKFRGGVKAVGDGLDSLGARCGKLRLTHAKLDEYIQLQKANDALNEAATDNLGVDTQAFTRKTDDVIGELVKLEGAVNDLR